MRTLFVLFFSLFYFFVPSVIADNLATDMNACFNNETQNCVGTCNRNADGEILLSGTSGMAPSDSDNANFHKAECGEALDEYLIRFYKVGICKTNPIASSGNTNPTDMCFDFFDRSSDTTDAGGKAITLSHSNGQVTADSSLVEDGVALELGQYNYAYAVLSNALLVKHTDTFSENVIGNGNSTGKVCWTIDKTTSNSRNTENIRGLVSIADYDTVNGRSVECGNNVNTATHAFVTDIIDDLGNGETFSAGSRAYVAYDNVFGTNLGGQYSALLLKNNNLDLATSRNDAFRIFYAIEFNEPLTITELTKSFEMSFNVSDAVELSFTTNGANQLVMYRAAALPFMIVFSAN